MKKTYLAIIGSLIIMLLVTSGGSLLFAQSDSKSDSGEDVLDPSDVENLKATPGDAEILLTWDAATDNVGVTGYKIHSGVHSVTEDEGSYDLPVIIVENATTYTVENLFNDQTYYFSATAVDAAGNESDGYATEVAATPKAGLKFGEPSDDGKAPQVQEVKAENVVTVLVIFSESVQLPVEGSESALQIEKTSDKSKLTVQKAEIDARDETKKTVLLVTAPQEENAEYVVTAGIEMSDLSGNPVISGTSDTGSFKGSAKKKPELVAEAAVTDAASQPAVPEVPTPEIPKDTEAPVVTGGVADFDDRMVVNFSEPVVLSDTPKNQFSVARKDTGAALELLDVSLSVDSKSAFLKTAKQEPVEYIVNVKGVKDETGNEVAATTSVTVTGRAASIEDLIPPEDVTKLIARIKDAKNNIVELKWGASQNSAGDLADQLLYQSRDRKGAAFGDSTSLGTSTTVIEVEDLQPGSWYTFKVTTKDTFDNESNGATASLYLPETGPGMVVAGLTALFMGWYSKRRKSM